VWCRVGLQKLPALLAACSMLVSCLDYTSTLKMKSVRSSKTSVDFYRILSLFITQHRILHRHCCENFESNKFDVFAVHSKGNYRSLWFNKFYNY
jgi:hypothetical protein